VDLTKSVSLSDDHVLLRQWSPADLDGLIEVGLHPKIWLHTVNCLVNPADARDYIETAFDYQRTGRLLPFAVVDRRKGAVVGGTGLGNVSTKDRRVEIGWTWLAVGSQGRGINTRAKYLLLEHCFESLSAHRVEFKTDAANRRARGALSKIGATPEGTLRSHTLMHDGRYRDTAYHSILADEWAQVRKRLRSLIESG
jgi:RimJ/RimL family protein N-acetyltransferase